MLQPQILGIVGRALHFLGHYDQRRPRYKITPGQSSRLDSDLSSGQIRHSDINVAFQFYWIQDQ